MTHARTANSRRRLASARRMMLLGCAAGAVLCGCEASAQSFQATSSVTHGSATVTTAPGQTNIAVGSPNAIIVWRPTGPGDPFIFQPGGTTATFTGNPGFAVLNRVLHDGRIQFDGTVLSRVGPPGAAVPGGIVAFYSPRGIILGGTALFDVGSLILTTRDPVNDPNGAFIDPTGAIDFQGDPANPGAEVVTLPGSRITALQENSYVLMLSPRVAHGGSVRVNGSAAYVGAASAVVRHNSGLFDIVVTGGTTAGTPIEHSGTTGGPASTGGTDRHNIYMTAISQDMAITALVGGTVGYDDALSATVENGAIILTAFSLGAPATNPATLSLGDGTYTSDVFGFSSHNASATGNATYEQDLTLIAGDAAAVSADGSIIQIGGNLSLIARDPTFGIDPTGGTATIEALNGGRVEIAGNAFVDASGVTSIMGFAIDASAVGGTAQVRADGGTVTVGGDLTINADGNAISAEAIPVTGGSGQGGTARLATTQNGSISVTGNLAATATASAQPSSDPTTPPTATGGAVSLSTQTGTINVTGTTLLAADAQGGTVEGDPGVAPGLARGGTVRVDVAGGQIDLGGVTTINTTATGGLGPVGGDAVGGAVTVQVAGGSIQLASGSSVDTSGEGGFTFAQPGGNGGNGTGGAITIAALNADSPSSITGGALSLVTQGRGGDGGSGQGSVLPGRGGNGAGGLVAVEAQRQNGRIQLGALAIDGRGFGGRGGGGDGTQTGGAGGDGFGSVFISIGTRRENPASSIPSNGQFVAASVDASAVGEGGAGGAAEGAGGTGGTGGRGGAGSIFLASQGAPVTVTGLARLAANAAGGAGGAANGGTAGATGTAMGGELVIVSSTGGGVAGSLTIGSLDGTLDAQGDGGTANQGGYFRIIADNSPMTLGTATITNGVTGNPAARQPSDFDVRNAAITVTTSGSFQSDGDLRFTGTGSGRLVGGSVSFFSNANITVDHTARPAGEPTIGVDQISFDAAGNFTASAGTLIRGTTSASVDADGTASFGDQILGQEIFVTSGGIEITDTGRIGDASTQRVFLGPRAPGARIGGDNVGSGYVLSAAEAGRITADRLTISVPSAGGPSNRPADLVVRDVTFDANAVGQLSINTAGIVQVEGALLVSNAAADSFIEITGSDGPAQRVQVITPGGGIRVRDSAGNPGGTVMLDAGDIWVTDQAILTQLLADPNFAGRNAALLANGGPVAPRGYVEGGTVELTPLRTLFVQNSGTATDFGGITVGGGTLTITAGAQGAPADVYAFGRAVRADGTMSTGNTFFFEGIYNGDYTPASELNLCNIPARTCPAPPPEEPGFGNPTPTVDEIEPPVEPGRGLAALDEVDEPIDSATAEPLIEEPVTSGGDSSAWTGEVEDRCRAEGEDRTGAESGDPPTCPPREPANE